MFISFELLIVWSSLSFFNAYTMGTIDVKNSVEDTESTMAVSPIMDSEEYYLQTMQLNSRHPKQPETSVSETKEDICQRIQRSTYFIDMFDDDYNFMRRRNNFEYARPAKCEHPDCLDRHDVFVSGNAVDEYMFSCRTENGNEFFVSREYDLFWWLESGAPYYGGRFVLKDQANHTERIVTAISEKPAGLKPSFFNSSDSEQDRFKAIFKHRTERGINDTMLNLLSPSMKVRLCTVVVSAFQWPFWFLPHPNNTEVVTLKEIQVPDVSSNEKLALGCQSDDLRTKGKHVTIKILLGDNRFTEFFAISKEEDIIAYLTR